MTLVQVPMERENQVFGIYVHWPFCQSKCPYCDFNSHVRETIDQARWRKAYLRELSALAPLVPARPVASVFFGGGTPSLMAPETCAAILNEVRRLFPCAPDLEVTLEANPGSAEAAKFRSYADAGINRVSIGVQALNDDALAGLGRRHSANEARRAIELAKRHFQRFSFDLIYARPGQSAAAWQSEIAEALSFRPRHLSLYQLTMEPGTAFHRLWQRGDLKLPEEERAAALYEATQQAMEAAGLPAYEISNHASEGEACRHNLIYWRAGDYLGIGPGAHGRLSDPVPVPGLYDPGPDPVAAAPRRLAMRQHRAPEVWLQRVEQRGQACQSLQTLGRQDRIEEVLMMGLRLRDGIDHALFQREAGVPFERLLSPARLAPLQDSDLLVIDGKGLRASAAGRLKLDALLSYILADARLSA